MVTLLCLHKRINITVLKNIHIKLGKVGRREVEKRNNKANVKG